MSTAKVAIADAIKWARGLRLDGIGNEEPNAYAAALAAEVKRLEKEHVEGFKAGMERAKEIALVHMKDHSEQSDKTEKQPDSDWVSPQAKMSVVASLASVAMECHCIAAAIDSEIQSAGKKKETLKDSSEIQKGDEG